MNSNSQSVILGTWTEARVSVVHSENSVAQNKHSLLQMNVGILSCSENKFIIFFCDFQSVFLTPGRLVYRYQCFGLASWPRLNSFLSLELARRRITT